VQRSPEEDPEVFTPSRGLGLRAKGLAVLAIPLVALVLVTAGFAHALDNQQRARTLARQTAEVRRQIQKVLMLLVDAETGARGFALTGKPEFLEPLEPAVAQLPAELQQLVTSLGGTAKVDPLRLQGLLDQRIAALGDLVTLGASPEPARAELEPVLDRGRQLMDQLRAELLGMDQQEERAQVTRLEQLAAADRTLRRAVWAGLLLGLLGGLASTVIFLRRIVTSLRELERNADRLAEGRPLERLAPRRDELGRLDRRMQLAAALLRSRDRELTTANENLQKSLSLLRATLDATTDGIAAVDRHKNLVLRNDRFVDMWGLSDEESRTTDQDELFKAIFQRIRNPDALMAGLRPAISSPDAKGCRLVELTSGDVFEVRYHPQFVGDEIVGRVWGVRDVTASHRHQEELELARVEAEAAREAAEGANKAKSEFLSRMSHELRTPLNAILGFGQLLEMDARDAGQRESVTQVLKAGRHLLGLIDEVLDIARIESGRFALSIEPVSVVETVAEVLDLIGPMAVGRRLTLDASGLTEGLMVLADRQRLKQVLLNLVSNAVKYNREGGTVRLTVSRPADGTVRLEVTDTGHGIAAEDRTKLFAPFQRIGAEQTDVQGTGLGLALSKVLTEAMGGTIGLRSTVGVGSTFWVEIAEAPPQVVLLEKGPVLGLEDRPPDSSSASRDGRPRLKLLYIEDNLSNLRLVERLMDQRPGTELLTAMQGSLGVELAQHHLPDLILLDLHLPDMLGDKVLENLRSSPATKQIPVVIVSADATAGHIRRLLEAGANEYLTKPLDLVRLLEVLDQYTRHEAGRP
jgi:signal transduction histidine kinase/CHASE3 domain sensor protein/ActR/RegA family two-component response regulator